MSSERILGSVVVANAKGGVGKTTVTANLAAAAARRGETVLAVDLDPQGNLAVEFGIEDHDEGKSLLAAAMDLGPLQPVPTGREGLSYVAAGENTSRLADMAFLESKGDPAGLARMIRVALEPFVADGVTIYIDPPPAAAQMLADAALMLGEWLLIPTKRDRGSLNGVPKMLKRILEMNDGAEDLIKPIGVVLFAMNPRATVMIRQIRDELETQLDGAFPVLDSIIRSAEKAERDSKNAGIVAHEYAQLATETEIMPWYEAVKNGVKDRLTFASNAAALAQDYESLAAEVQRLIDPLPAEVR